MEQPDSALQVLFICGAGRSGSTLLEGLLADALPNALPVGEIRQVWVAGLRRDSLCECGRTFRTCPLWSAVVQRLEATDGVDIGRTTSVLHRVVRVRHLRRLLSRGMDDDERYLGATLERLYGAAAADAQVATIIDSSKAPQYALFLAKATGFDLHVLHLVRDSRAVAHSWSRTKVFDPQSPQTMRRRTTLQSAWRWNRHNALALLLRRRASSYQRITYEELANDPASVVSRAVDSVDVHAARGSLAASARGHSFMGNPVRFDRPSAADIVLDDEWRVSMSRRDRLTVTLATCVLLHHFGYELRT